MLPAQAATTPRPQTIPWPVLCAGRGSFALLTPEGEISTLDQTKAQFAVHNKPVLVCHAPYMAQRLKAKDFLAVDILSLYAFVHPAKFCVPTPAGLAKALGLTVPHSLDDYPFSLVESAQALLSDLRAKPNREKLLSIAEAMGLNGRGWPWTPFVFAALGETYDSARIITSSRNMLNVWSALPEWGEDPPPSPSGHDPISGEDARQRLKDVLAFSDHAEARPEQMNYATRLSEAFQAKDEAEQTHVVLAEAGTGVGKTLGYLAPASVWSEKNDAPVWISTYTKNLQRQIETELDRIYPEPAIKAARVAVRKGRENYLCLLNYEENAAGAALAKHINTAIATGLMGRWVMETKDGDLSGTDFLGWLPGLVGQAYTNGLADRRGECIFSACDHYRHCFSERSIRKAKHSAIVIANHAVVMTQTALAGDDDVLPQRYIFDEGHHVFEAADSTFAGHLTGQEMYNFRRWIVGPEGGRKSRARGLKKRLEDLISDDVEATDHMNEVIHHARFLCGEDWLKHMQNNQPDGTGEKFIAAVYEQTFARAEGRHGPYTLETDVFPLSQSLIDQSVPLREKMTTLRNSMISLATLLRKKLAEQSEDLNSDTRKRFEAVSASLERRANMTLSMWVSMLENLHAPQDRDDVVDWMAIERQDGHVFDIGYFRNYVDPTKPFAAALKPHAHSVVITSATLRDVSTSDDTYESWKTSRVLTGAESLSDQAAAFSIASPFDYAKRTKVFIITDVNRDDMDQMAAAYRGLFEASNGGALGLFTAINRLKSVHGKIQEPLEKNGLTLFSQHVDGVDTGTLVDMFRDDTHSCLLGTDAIRDGVDIPGDALRLIVFDRVPWPRATILHKARRLAFGKKDYDDRLARLKLKQAFGRLIRRADDRGVFVILDNMLPSRLLNAFPEGVEVQRIGLKDTINTMKEFFKA